MPAPPQVVGSVCRTGSTNLGITPMSPDTLTVNGSTGEKVDFTVTQTLVDEGGMAVLYNGENINSLCDVSGNLKFGDSK